MPHLGAPSRGDAELSTRDVGQIGLGAVGQHFAARLLNVYGDLDVFDTDRERVLRLQAQGATPLTSARALAARCDTIVLSLPSAEAVETVFFAEDGLLESVREDTLIIDTSSIDPPTCKKVHDASRKLGASYLDAPVTSGPSGSAGAKAAEKGTFTFLIGGAQSDFERAKPILGHLGHEFLHLGPTGSGSVMKLVTNHISGIHTLALAEGLVLAVAAGFDLDRALEVTRKSVANSYVLEDILIPRVNRGEFKPGFAVDLMAKDQRLAGELGERLGIPTAFNQLALQTWQQMQTLGRGRKDHTDCINFLAELAGVDLGIAKLE